LPTAKNGLSFHFSVFWILIISALIAACATRMWRHRAAPSCVLDICRLRGKSLALAPHQNAPPAPFGAGISADHFLPIPQLISTANAALLRSAASVK